MRGDANGDGRVQPEEYKNSPTSPPKGTIRYWGESWQDNLSLVAILPQLRDIATRWHMFYFHHFMSVALEGLFSWLVSHVAARELAWR